MNAVTEAVDDAGRILIVDDNPTNIDVLFDYLSDLGYDVLVAEDGVSAIERLDYAIPDLILLDVMMPRMDGFETCQRLKADPRFKDIPVIFMTALDSVDDKVKGFSAGAIDYITKPFQSEEVHVRVKTHISLVRMQRALRLRNDQLAEQNEALDAYARTVAHDLKNPLNLIINFARLIQGDNVLQGTQAEDLDLIVRNGERMDHIIQDMLLLAKMRQDQVEPVRLNLEAIFRQSADRLSHELKESKAEVTCPTEWPVAMGHAAWVQAVFVNYISNAIKYGGTPPRIVVSVGPAAEQEGFCRVDVRDSGNGVPEKLRYKIFEDFSRVGGEEAEGHGIGLSIVRRIISKLGGRVGVENNADGVGCTFYFTLPLAKKID